MFLFLDYDGTLVPIVNDPERAIIHPKRKNFILSLSEKFPLSIITGRSFSSFKKVFGEIPQELYLITSHGATIRKGERVLYKSHASVPDTKEIERELAKLEGVIFEKKEGCFAVHYRNAPQQEKRVREVFENFISKNPPVRVIEGKMVLEALYGDFDKGKGVQKLIEIEGFGDDHLIYIGDDRTDLIAFEKVKSLGGRTVFVGGHPTPQGADEVLKSVDEVYTFLRTLTGCK